MIKNIFTKQNLKRVGIVILGLLALFFVVILAGDKYYRYSQEKAQKKLVEEMNRPYLEDTYGGKTPEETFAMFLDALKKGDIELASKYFDIKKQGEWKNILQKVKDDNELSILIDELSQGLEYKGSLYKGNKQYQIKDKNGKIIYSLIDFSQYPSGIWKINLL
ncbi:MAG: hypothetical protein HYV52_03910 [Parcubacteria group bacterium]|nr:hypothetical protein [Parcubacteria group bacterium]